MLYNWQSIKLNPTTTTHKSIIYSVFSDKLFNWQSTHYNYIVHLLLHFRKISFANIVSNILDLWGLRIMPPWLNTRSTGALDAGTLGALAAGITNLARVCRWACQKDMQQSKWCTIAVTVNGYQYLSLKYQYQYPCLKYKYSTSVPSTSTSTSTWKWYLSTDQVPVQVPSTTTLVYTVISQQMSLS